MSFRQLFSSYISVEKAAKTTFVRKRRVFNVDEIDTWTVNGTRLDNYNDLPEVLLHTKAVEKKLQQCLVTMKPNHE
jgi:hypothetical protein